MYKLLAIVIFFPFLISHICWGISRGIVDGWQCFWIEIKEVYNKEKNE